MISNWKWINDFIWESCALHLSVWFVSGRIRDLHCRSSGLIHSESNKPSLGLKITSMTGETEPKDTHTHTHTVLSLLKRPSPKPQEPNGSLSPPSFPRSRQAAEVSKPQPGGLLLHMGPLKHFRHTPNFHGNHCLTITPSTTMSCSSQLSSTGRRALSHHYTRSTLTRIWLSGSVIGLTFSSHKETRESKVTTPLTSTNTKLSYVTFVSMVTETN